MEIQWYPGHMAKAERQIREQAAKADVIAVMGDARAVGPSINSDFLATLGKKKYIIVYNKASLADEAVTREWDKHFADKNEKVFFTDCVSRRGMKAIVDYFKEIKDTFKFKREIRVIVAGIPNVGKSMFINTLSGKSSAKTGNMPGVTRGANWIKGGDTYYLLDTPGVLPPKFESPREGALLASIGCVKDEILDRQQLALFIIDLVKELYPELLIKRYGIKGIAEASSEIFDEICINRSFLLSRERLDYARGARCILDEFKNGKIGSMSFTSPKDLQ